MVELGKIFASLLVATNLAELGADVIKIEQPPGDDVRKTGRFKAEQGLWFTGSRFL